MATFSSAVTCTVGCNRSSFPEIGSMEMPYDPEVPPWFMITFAGLNGAGFCLNVLSIWLLATRTLVYKYKVNCFLVSLCCSDILVALSSFYYLATITAGQMSDFSKRVSTLIFGFALETSMMSLVCLTYERLTAIRQPFRYKEIMSKTNVSIILTFGWLFCTAISAAQFIFAFVHKHDKYIYINWVVFIGLSVIAITFLVMVYSYLVYEIHRHTKHIKSTAVCSAHPRNSLLMFDSHTLKSGVHLACDERTEVSYMSGTERGSIFKCASSTLLNNISSDPSSRKGSYKTPRQSLKSGRGSQNTLSLPRDKIDELRLLKHRQEVEAKKHSQQLLIRKERQSLLLCICIVVMFVGCWVPVIVLFIRCLWFGTCKHDDTLLYISSCLVSLNSLLDPIVYFIVKREFRDFVRKSICKSNHHRYNSNRRRSRGRSSTGDLVERGTRYNGATSTRNER